MTRLASLGRTRTELCWYTTPQQRMQCSCDENRRTSCDGPYRKQINRQRGSTGGLLDQMIRQMCWGCKHCRELSEQLSDAWFYLWWNRQSLGQGQVRQSVAGTFTSSHRQACLSLSLVLKCAWMRTRRPATVAVLGGAI